MHIRFLEYLVTLARERHFARAAAACDVSQPTLSSGLAALEAELKVRLVERDRRFLGLTPEGEAVLPWAKAMIANHRELQTALIGQEAHMTGEVRLGVIPAAMHVCGSVVQSIVTAHPSVTVSLRSMTSREIKAGLIAQEIHAGLTYLNHDPLPMTRQVPLATERYVFATRTDARLGQAASVTWEEVSRERLCLLHDGMQNRRILDKHLATRRIQVSPVAVTDSYVTLIAMVEAGDLSTVISDSYAPYMAGAANVRIIPFDDAAPPNVIGMVVADRPPMSRISRAILECARRLQQSRTSINN